MPAPLGNPRYRYVAFDAVGTLIRANPSVASVYQFIGHRYGCQMGLAEIQMRFQESFAKRQLEEQTSETKEYTYWKEIVSEVIGAVDEAEACFKELYEHFARPESWELIPNSAETIETLQRWRIRVAVASNFDHRLRSVMAGHSGLSEIQTCVISSEIGWRKPSPQFYEALCQLSDCRPEEILMVGDDLQNDVIAAREAGLAACLFAPENLPQSSEIGLTSLQDVLQHCFQA